MSDKETHAPVVCYSLLLERHHNLVSYIATPAAAICYRDSCVHDLQWRNMYHWIIRRHTDPCLIERLLHPLFVIQTPALNV